MVLTASAVLSGVLLGLIRSGSLASLLSTRVRLWGALLVGILLQFTEFLDVPYRSVLYPVGLGLTLVGLLANVRLSGAAITALGVGLNLLVFVLNGYIPLRWEALTAARPNLAGSSPSEFVLTRLREFETPETALGYLGDVIPIELTGSVLSFGDLITAAGVIVLVMNMMGHRRRRLSVDDFVDDTALRRTTDWSTPDDDVVDLGGVIAEAQPSEDEYVRVVGRGGDEA